VSDRAELLEQHGRAYGELRLAITFTEANAGDPQAKRVTAKGWPATRPLADGDYGAALLKSRGTGRNPAVVLGASGLVGIDVDGTAGIRLLHELHPARLPRTVTVETGRASGFHLWYRRPARLTGSSKIELGEAGVEISKDGYLIAPPGVHHTGRVYRFAEGLAPWEFPPAVLAFEHLHPFLAYANRDRKRAVAAAGPIAAGGRHRHLRRIAGAMCRVGALEQAIVAALLIENEARCCPPKEERLVRELARDMHARYAPKVRT